MPKQRHRVTLALGKRASGLSAIGHVRGWEVRVNGREVATISPLYVGWGHKTDGWYFVARDEGLGIPLRNTCGERGVPVETVKAAALAYIKECLAHPSSPHHTIDPKGNDK